MESSVVQIYDLGQGFTIEQLENEAGHIFYRMCKGSICRYCEDEYMAYMYAESAGWDKSLTDPQLDRILKMRFPEMLGTKPVQPICTRPFTHVAGITTCNKVGSPGVSAFGFRFDVIERAGSPQRLSTIRTFIPPKVKDMLSKSGFRLTFIEEFRALDVVFHTGTALQ